LDLEIEVAWELLKIQLTLQQKAWVPHSRFSPPWHFFIVNDDNKLDLIRLQTMWCVICHSISQAYTSNNTIKKKKGLITFNQQHGTTCMKKHILPKHPTTWQCWKSANLTFVVKDNYQEKGKQICVVGYGEITEHFGNVNLYKKDDLQQKKFTEDLLFFVVKCYMFISIVESQWLRHLAMCQNPRVVFPNWKQMVQHTILSLVAKTMDHYVMLALDSCVITTASFDL